MAFKVPEADIGRYYKEGYIVFRGILPTSLISDLRRECDKAVKIIRREKGPQEQRLQPVHQYAGELDIQPFKNYAELPELHEALAAVLTPEHRYGSADILGVLIEPEQFAYCTAWHRDMTLESSRLPAQDFQDLMLDWNCVNQINCPLYDDDCTWFVPGSHLRMRDLPGETAWSRRNGEFGIERTALKTDAVTRERACLEYTSGMPGAVQFQLHAGDFAMYRPIGWHIGNYVTYKKRATLHDGVFTPQYEAWWRQWIKGGSPKWIRKVNAAS
jgi:hypothetical protein